MEDCFADQPQELVGAGPEHALGDERRAAKDLHAVDDIAETENQTSDDDGWNQRCEDFSQCRHCFLKRILIFLGRLLDLILRDALDAGHFDEVIVEIRYVVADDNLELTGLRESSFDDFHLLKPCHVRLLRIVEHKPHSGHTVRNGSDVALSADQPKHHFGIFRVLSHAFPFHPAFWQDALTLSLV